ncbi:hypothetical protein [Actinosynnema pretiosum]|uniref:hypothetical protein n=1 Tax=Actinosynnema pretiosum TaxID=42197 RepID=UPI0018DF4457|nr:hypothetical protein [Actinosynnema pretiosum]
MSNGWERLMGQSRETSAHRGSHLVELVGDGLVARPHPDDPDASPAIGNVDAYRHRSRVTRPAVRRRLAGERARTGRATWRPRRRARAQRGVRRLLRVGRRRFA